MKKLFTKLAAIFKEFIADCKAETPKIWQVIRNIAGGVTIAIGILSGIGTQFPSLEVPSWFSQYGWYIAGLCALIVGYSARKKVAK